ncbi:MAG: hypothetical protein IKV59_06605 [Lachnospiraceae bacterium]|nr:hypothetical protein [Lachnospiraceae bacterium]
MFLVKDMDRSTMTGGRIIGISSNGQITIPQKYFDELGFGTEAQCFIMNDGILLKPYYGEITSVASEILRDVLADGFQGEDILKEFERRSGYVDKIRRSIKASEEGRVIQKSIAELEAMEDE